MKNYLQDLSKAILSLEPNGISKVRLAKVIYFVHKYLVQKGAVNSQELMFIRMPLGPVPVGYRSLKGDSDIEVEILKHGLTLLYDSQMYKVKEGFSSDLDFIKLIEQAYFSLKSYPTSELVSMSHEEPSWKNYSNGDEYYLSTEDLKISTPVLTKATKSDATLEKQKLQAELVTGMLDEIVDDSTGLEYPDK